MRPGGGGAQVTRNGMEEEVAARMEEEPDLVLHDHIFYFPFLMVFSQEEEP